MHNFGQRHFKKTKKKKKEKEKCEILHKYMEKQHKNYDRIPLSSMKPTQFFSHFVLLHCLLSLLLVSANADSCATGGDWLNHGGGIFNRRYADKVTKISPSSVSNLTLKWKFFAGKDITATPTIYNGTLYFPCWNGNIYAVKASDGSLVWQKNVHQLTGLNATGIVPGVNAPVSRSSPTVAGDFLIVGIYGPAIVIALRLTTGELVWSTQLESHFAGVITMSGTYHARAFYVGTSSVEESASIGQCCTFRGSFSKLNAQNGDIIWQKYILRDNNGNLGGYSGAAIWGSSPPIDVPRNSVYIATGNLYSTPESVEQCQELENNQTTPTHPDSCLGPDIHSESILAFDLDTGVIKWYKQLGGYHVWYFACNDPNTPGCPPGPNPDADFGEAPMMLTVHDKGTKRDIVAAVQKNGFAWALDRDNGTVIWSTAAGPGSISGGGIWGAATDQKRVYTNIGNGDRKNFTLNPSLNKTTNAGGWVAMDALTGKILWSTADPGNGLASGPVTVANGVVFVGSTNGTGPIYAMNAATGEILWSSATGATVYGGMSVSDGCAYFGNGYKSGLGFFNPSFVRLYESRTLSSSVVSTLVMINASLVCGFIFFRNLGNGS